MEKGSDIVIIVPNQAVASDEEFVNNSYEKIDAYLYGVVKSLSDLMSRPGYINVDFADFQTIIKSSGRGVIGIGEAKGVGRAKK